MAQLTQYLGQAELTGSDEVTVELRPDHTLRVLAGGETITIQPEVRPLDPLLSPFAGML